MDLILHTILPFVGILVVLIVFHELGHFITAKLTGVKVLEAGLGYPPRVWGFPWRGTLYSINWLPLGGFVRLLGEEDPSDPASLAAKPRWVRLIVLFAGSGMNFLLPIFLFALAFMIPRDVSVGLTQITGVAPQSPAEEAVPGPVGIAQATGEVVEQSGWQTLLEFAALLSINLAIINVLPLPMLDGGRIPFVLLGIVG